MTAIDPQYSNILKKFLDEKFVPYLPPLIFAAANPEERATKQRSRAFGAFALHKILDISPSEASSSVVDDVNDKGVDVVYYHQEKKVLYLVQAKLKESEQFKQEDAQSFCRGVRLLINQDLDKFNKNITSRKDEIYQALDECETIKLVIAYTGDGCSRSATESLEELLDDDSIDEERVDQNVLHYTGSDVVRDLLAEKSYPKVNADLVFHKHGKVEDPRITYYGIVRLADLVALHKDKGKALYERNIRYFLGSGKSGVNKAIKETLRDDPKSFFYLNNGVTAVCDEVEQKGKSLSKGGRKFKVRGLSIINGAQTVASAAEFMDQNPNNDIEDVKLMFTLIKAPADGNFGKRVTRARNYQNPVQTANFASLDERQEILRQEISLLGYSYNYRPEVLETSSSVISIEEAIRAIALCKNDPRYPAWLKSEPSRLTNPDSEDYNSLFSNGLTGLSLINAVLSSRAIRALIDEYEKSSPSGSQEKLLYRHANHVMAAVMLKRLRKRIGSSEVIDLDAITELISKPLDELRQQIKELGESSLGGKGPLAYFRNQGNVVYFMAELMKVHFSMERDSHLLSLSSVNSTLGSEINKTLFDYFSNKAPQI